MSTRLPPILHPPIGFGRPVADVGADLAPGRGDDPIPPDDGYRRARDLGATGMAAQVWVTADGVPVLHDRGRVGSRLRRRPIDRLRADELPADVVPLSALLDLLGPGQHLSLDLVDGDAIDVVLDVVGRAGHAADDRLWLGHGDLHVLTGWRPRTGARLVNTGRHQDLPGGLERRAAELEQLGIDGLRLPHGDWTGGRVALLHRFGRLALGDDPVHEREVAAVVDSGIDGVYSDQVTRMMAVIVEYYGAV